MFSEGFRSVDAMGAHPIELKRGIEEGKREVLGLLSAMKVQLTTLEDIRHVCLIASNFDEELSQVVAQALHTVGVDGILNLFESSTLETKFHLINGLTFERGLASELLVQENKTDNKIEMELPLVLVVANKIADTKRLMPVLDRVKKTGRPLLIFSEHIMDEPLSMLVYNATKQAFASAAVNVPWQNGLEKEVLKDIATVVGATVVDDEFDLKLEDLTLDHFGSA